MRDVNVAMAGWPKACHTLAHGVPWVFIMGFKIWLKACHSKYPVNGYLYTTVLRGGKYHIYTTSMHAFCVTWHAMSNKYPFTGYLL